jgi:DNA-binding response OmpR family regulator
MNHHHRIASFSCPTCGGHIAEAAGLDAVREAVTAPAQRLIFDMLSKRAGQPVERDRIMSRVYGDRADGGPERGDVVLKVHVSKLRKKLEPFGWTITNSRGGSGNLAQWRLIPTGDRA